jgi:hypothetical protein
MSEVEPYTEEELRDIARFLAGDDEGRLLATIEAYKAEVEEARNAALEEVANYFECKAASHEAHATRDASGRWTNGPAMAADACLRDAARVRDLKVGPPEEPGSGVFKYISAQARSALAGRQPIAGALRVIKANADMRLKTTPTEKD